MSQPSRPQARRPERRKRGFMPEGLQHLEERALLAPLLSIRNPQGGVTATPNADNTSFIIAAPFNTTPDNTLLSSAPSAAVSLLTPRSEFGGDMTRIEAGPGGPFGRGVYAISRGTPGRGPIVPENDPNQSINRPGVIYRVDPATGKASVFFDLNTVVTQLPEVPPGPTQPPADAANDSLSVATGLANWYDLTFDAEGYFDGRPSLFVSSVDDIDARQNAIYRVAPDGTLISVFTQFVEGLDAGRLRINPSAVLTPPAEQQTFLRGLIAGDAESLDQVGAGFTDQTPAVGFEALFFDANQFRPTQRITDKNILPVGVSETSLHFGPQVAIVSSNNFYPEPVYSVFTNFGIPTSAAGAGTPGHSGVEGFVGLNTNLFTTLISGNGSGNFDTFVYGPASTAANNTDIFDAALTPYRRFQDAAFDKFGHFSYGETIPVTGLNNLGATTFAGSLFVSDLASGLTTFLARPTTQGLTYPQNFPAGFNIPVYGDGQILVTPIAPGGNVTGLVYNYIPNSASTRLDGLYGGRVVRIDGNGTVRLFAENFNIGRLDLIDLSTPYLTILGPTTGGGGFITTDQPVLTAPSFFQQNLSLTFSGDGTTLYVSDNDGIWQFKTNESLANSQSGSLVGLGDLRALQVPYDGRDSAVAVVDTGVQAAQPNFRGRVSRGINFAQRGRGPGNVDALGHGTNVAGVIHQFVPEATLLPVNVFQSFTGGANGGTTLNAVYRALEYVSKNPFVSDPIRANKQDRVIAANLGFGTNRIFRTEAEAFGRNKQSIVALKNQLHRLRGLGIAAVAPNGQTTVAVTAAPDQTIAATVPSLLNEVISVGGVYGFPFEANNRTSPLDDVDTFAATAQFPVRLFPLGVPVAALAPLVAFETLTGVFADRIVGTSNRTSTTDFVAPMLELPTFGLATGGGSNVTPSTIVNLAGTSGAAAVVTGSIALTASALDFWGEVRASGFTDDAYINVPVGTRTLDFGRNTLIDLSAYANPDGINSILQWTAVPVADIADDATTATPPPLIGQAPARGEFSIDDASPGYRNFSRVDVGNAVAAIEGRIALDYLIRRDQLKLIDGNNNGLITAQELQTFVDGAAKAGVAEAGALARFLGGSAQPSADENDTTFFGQRPDQIEVLQRRYNFFDFAVDGKLDGVISLDQYQNIVHRLLPAVDSFTVVDRVRSSGNGYLLAPDAPRAYRDLQKLSPRFVYVEASQVKKFRGVSPARFGVASSEIGGFGLFGEINKPKQTTAQIKTVRGGLGTKVIPAEIPDAPPAIKVQAAAAAAAAAATLTTPATTDAAAPAASTPALETASSGKAQAPAERPNTQAQPEPTQQPAQSDNLLQMLQGLVSSGPATITAGPVSPGTPTPTGTLAGSSTPTPTSTSTKTVDKAIDEMAQSDKTSDVRGGERAKIIMSSLNSLASKSLPERRAGLLQLNQNLVAQGYEPFNPYEKKGSIAKDLLGPTLGQLVDKLF